MKTASFIGVNTREGYTLIVELEEFMAENGYRTASVKKTLKWGSRSRQKWTDFGFKKEQPPAWQAKRHYDAYVENAVKNLGFKPQISGKQIMCKRGSIAGYDTTVKRRSDLEFVWEQERQNTYAGAEMD